MQYCGTTQISGLCRKDQMHIISCTRSPMKCCRCITQGMPHSLIWLDNPLNRMHCTHYTSSLYGKLGDEMTGRFNQDLQENLQMAFKKTTNFESRIITKQSINSRKIYEVNHIDIGHEDDIEINKAHVRNPNYKGKNYDPNFTQNKLKTTNNNTNNTSTHNTSNNQNNTTTSYGSSSQHSNSNSGYGYSKSNRSARSNCIRSRRY